MPRAQAVNQNWFTWVYMVAESRRTPVIGGIV